jgi:glucose-1-phosphate thymidylyltransferase
MTEKTIRGIALAGGHGTRLHPFTVSVSRGVLHNCDTFLFHYPIPVLVPAGIWRIAITSLSRIYPQVKRRLAGDLHVSGEADSFVSGLK